MTVYLGPVGRLIAIPDFGERLANTLDIPTVVHDIAGTRGGRVVQRIGAPKRTYTLGFAGLTLDELSLLETLVLGGYGPGPYVLLDPWRSNLLSANQSSGTDVLADTTGFAAATGTIASDPAQADLGLRSLAWAVTAANQQVLTGNLTSVTASDDTVDIPVLPSTSYAAAVRDRISASTGTARLDMRWFDRSEVFISESTGTATALSAAGFTSLPCVATSPANAALLRLKVQNTVMGAAQTHYLDQWQLAMAAAVPAWTIGTGVPRVSFTESFGQTYPIFPSVTGSLTLTEV